MTKPKKVAIVTTNSEPPIEEVKETNSEPTPIKTVKVEEVKQDPRPLRKGDTYLFIKDGRDVYYTAGVANVIFQRNSASVVIPKGSKYIPPKGSKCDGCG